ncbi:rod shape-determining protein MreC [Breznakia sp. PF5-3]|uniref:rod shape-determining protein MreC n=1 Tax=unclassified Breznakia TaxID=2623764 RepID=UPI00240701AC|nr:MULTISPECIES: rod shape-determining protein MreC [unclassified Breznakia]MDF9824128.1 rod shape-determining protein MreC [Breznakia sp. PM6-1]MDF9834926.1 rod shape-determining protein MreC [Breznakia sp. PF5-3]MDF9837205.1 rod shape-determining protein MreC [Breznakia sp. PFB2-8]MDF9859195.1 rod shape-determining protein MreC [Breznakia sp. PH5-24]
MERFSKVYRDKFRFTRVQKVLITICACLLTFGIFTRIIGGNIASKYGYDVFTMLRYSLIDHPVETVAGFSDDFSNLWNVQNENDELRNKLASQKMYKEELDESKRKLNELEELMDISSSNNYESISARVLVRDIQGWSNMLTINKGSNDGITEDMAVISSKGLIGKVVEANPTSAKVKLLTNEKMDNSVSVKVELSKDKATDGSLESYDKSTGKYVVSIFDSNVEIKKGMKIITSGKGKLFPAGIIIGEVDKVEDLYNAEGKSVLVTPSVDFNDFEYVSVLKVK